MVRRYLRTFTLRNELKEQRGIAIILNLKEECL
jgi:hypothetical protein